MSNDNSIMPYGEYKGLPINEIPAKYMVRLWDTEFSRTPPHKLTYVGKYIKANLDKLRKQALKK